MMLPLIVLIIVNGGKDVLKNVDIARGIQMWKTSASRPRAEGTLSAHQPETIAEEVL